MTSDGKPSTSDMKPPRGTAARAVLEIGPARSLPLQLTSFIGREREIGEIKRLLHTARLLTLLGPPGTGKTRLALQAGSQVAGRYADGVWFVDLAPLSDGTSLTHSSALSPRSLVPQAIASALGLREQGATPILETLKDRLLDRELLIVLDNCEHLAAECADVASSLLRACPFLRILATSRQMLGLAGEMVWHVPPLSVPPIGESIATESHVRYEAVRLFVERAQLKRHNFALTEENAPHVAQLCRHLDGLPLAIELAAARVSVLSVEQLLARLGERFRLLAGAELALPRQQTLRAALDWSYNLLSADEQQLLRRLSVFAGGFTLDAVEAVCAPETDTYQVLDLLSQLVDKSLVVVEGWNGQTRYRLLETIQHYSSEKLAEVDEAGAGEVTTLRDRHLRWYIQLAEEAEAEFNGKRQMELVAQLEKEHDNLRAALGWAQSSGQAQAALRLSAALWQFWRYQGRFSEGREYLAKALAMPDGDAERTVARARALHGAGVMAFFQGDYPTARRYFEESLAIFREADDCGGVAVVLNGLALTSTGSDTPGPDELLSESLRIFRQLNDRYGMIVTLNNIGNRAMDRGDYARARELYSEAATLSRGLGNKRATATTLSNLGEAVWAQGDYAEAQALYEEASEVARESGHVVMIAASLANLGDVAFREAGLGRSDYARARELYEENLALVRRLGDRRATTHALTILSDIARYEGDHERAVALLKEALGLLKMLEDRGGIARCLERFGIIGAAGSSVGDLERSVWLLAAAQTMREAASAPTTPAQQAEVERALAHARSRLGKEAFEVAWSHARATPWQRTLDRLLAETETKTYSVPAAAQGEAAPKPPPRHKPGADELSRRELEVLQLLADGLPNQQIAERLFLSTNTVRAHLHSIYSKLDVSTRAAAVRFALQHSLLDV